MKYYAIAEVTVTDPRWVPEYLANVTSILESYGGKYLARTANFELMEGDALRHQTTIILEFPSREAAYSFYESKEYRPYREARVAGSTGTFSFVAGEDAASE